MPDQTKKEIELLNQIVNSIQEGIVVLDPELRIKKANNWILSRLNEEDVTDAYCYKLYMNRESPCTSCPVIRTFQTAKPNREIIEDPFRENNGSIFEISTYPILDDTGKVEKVIENYRDITRQKLMEIELQENKKKLERIFSVAPTGIGHVKDRVITDVNKKVVEMSGYEVDELTGKSSLQLYPSKKEFDFVGNEKYDQIKKYGTGIVETQWRRKDGKIIDVLLASTPLDTNDLSKGTIFTALDISERKKYIRTLNKKNLKLKKAKEKAEESNRLKTEFLNNMSHEIRTPMNGIIGFTELLDKENLTVDKRRYYTRIIQNSSKQLLRVINDILEISTLETHQLKIYKEPFCLNDLLKELFSVFNLKSQERNIPIYLKKGLSDDQSIINSDRSQLIKILSNLIENALKFTNKGFIEIGYDLNNSDLIIYVKDTGRGISPQNQEIIFERFTQEDKDISRQHGGLGLGLSISRESAKLLGGDIRLESEKGKGTTFFLSIPYEPAGKAEIISDTSSNSEMHPASEPTILVVEDEEINYLYIETLFENLTDRNIILIHAKNGREAVDICTQRKKIDLILMDIKMPVMNGHEATKKIKAIHPEIPVIAQTAYSTKADEQLALKYGCDGYISKPIDKNRLFLMVNEYLNTTEKST
jgi:PAS domain S-box-containing protein